MDENMNIQNSEESGLPQMEDAVVHTQGVINPEDVDVSIVCEAGSVQISLAKLSQLKIGDALELSRWPNTVRLLIDRRPIAEGVLVDISGMLAVKITRKL